MKAIFVGLLMGISSLTAFAGFTSVTGRITDINGTGMSHACAHAVPAPVSSCPEWPGTVANTNAFGYYTIEVPNDCSFMISPTDRVYTLFAPSSQLFTIEGGTAGPFTDVNFQGQE